MHRFQKILFPTDFTDVSANALRYTLWFADQCSAEIQVVHVIFPETEGLDFPAMSANATQKRVEAATSVFDAFIQSAKDALQSTYALKSDPIVSADVLIGVPGRAINDAAEKRSVDLIAMGAKEHHGWYETTFGGIAASTMVRAQIPVLIIPEETDKLQIRTVCYAADLCDADRFHIWESAQLLKDFNPYLKIVHVHSLTEKPTQIQLDDLSAYFSSQKPLLQTTFHEVGGEHLWTALNDFVSENGSDMVVMHTPQRTLIQRLGHQSQTKKMTLHSNVPLLILK